MSEISALKASYLEPNIPRSNNSNFCSRQKKTQNAEENGDWKTKTRKPTQPPLPLSMDTAKRSLSS